MKTVFNDASELQVQNCTASGGVLRIKVLASVISLDDLEKKMSDPFTCKQIDVYERGQKIDTHENYTELKRLEKYPGGILCAVMDKVGETAEERLDGMDTRVTAVEGVLDIIVGGADGEWCD